MQKTDTLKGIALKFGVSSQVLKKINMLLSDHIFTDQLLIVPKEKPPALNSATHEYFFSFTPPNQETVKEEEKKHSPEEQKASHAPDLSYSKAIRATYPSDYCFGTLHLDSLDIPVSSFQSQAYFFFHPFVFIAST